MVASIHQPAYIPWLGYFHKIAQSDIHIFFDDAQYSKNNFFNRNRLKTPNGVLWLTVPVKYKSDVTISRTKIDNTKDWRKKHWKTIKLNYAKAPYFKEYVYIFEKFYQLEWEYLSELTITMNMIIAELLEIKVKFLKSSELKTGGVSNEKLINLCKATKADTYLSGQGAAYIEFNNQGRPYLDQELFLKNNIKVKIQEFSCPIYHQLWSEFVPNLSMLDFIFNCGVNKFKELYLTK